MIGFLFGEILFSDGHEVIIQTQSGLGYQVFFNQVLIEGSLSGIYISHIIKEDSETMYGFLSLRSKKLFEMLLSVKGIGPKSAYALVCHIGVNEIIQAVSMDAKNILTKVPGLGSKGAAQIVLDLGNKIEKVKMYSDQKIIYRGKKNPVQESEVRDENSFVQSHFLDREMMNLQASHTMATNDQEILSDTIMACKELGFKEEKVIQLAQKILSQNQIARAEQLIHLVLKQI